MPLAFLQAHTILGDSMHLVDVGVSVWENYFRVVKALSGGIDAFVPLV